MHCCFPQSTVTACTNADGAATKMNRQHSCLLLKLELKASAQACTTSIRAICANAQNILKAACIWPGSNLRSAHVSPGCENCTFCAGSGKPGCPDRGQWQQ